MKSAGQGVFLIPSKVLDAIRQAHGAKERRLRRME